MPDFWQLLIDIFFPAVCIQCKQRIYEGLLCPACRKKLEDCRLLQPKAYCCKDIDGICLLYRYDAGVKKALHDVKFRGKKRLVAGMAEEMSILESPKRICSLWHLAEKILVVPIPTDRERVKQRGYDVPYGIFNKWSLKQGFTWYEALERIRPTRPQYGLDRSERRKNVRGCFAASKDIRGKQVLLVDDIFTSGATAQEAAHVLHQQGADHIWMMAFAGGGDGCK